MAVLVNLAVVWLLLLWGGASAMGWTGGGWGTVHTRRETNADRLSRGLPPLTPRKLFNPSRSGPSLSRRSVTPSPPVIAVTALSSGTPMCYIGISNCAAQSAAVPFTPSMGYGYPGAQDLDITSGSNTGYNLFIENEGFTTISATSENFLLIGTANNMHSNPGALPATDQSTGWTYESAVWYVDAQGDISAEWVNTDGSVAPLIFFTTGTSGTYSTYATGDPNSLYGGTQVTLKLIS